MILIFNVGPHSGSMWVHAVLFLLFWALPSWLNGDGVGMFWRAVVPSERQPVPPQVESGWSALPTVPWTHQLFSLAVPMVISILVTLLFLRSAPRPARRAALQRDPSLEIAKLVQQLPIQAFETEAELSQLPSPALKERLQKYSVNCSDCIEKGELVQRLVDAGGSSGSTCSVCFEDYEGGDLMRILPCSHRYHVHCIDQWLLTKASRQGAVGQRVIEASCPICSKRIDAR